MMDKVEIECAGKEKGIPGNHSGRLFMFRDIGDNNIQSLEVKKYEKNVLTIIVSGATINLKHEETEILKMFLNKNNLNDKLKRERLSE